MSDKKAGPQAPKTVRSTAYGRPDAVKKLAPKNPAEAKRQAQFELANEKVQALSEKLEEMNAGKRDSSGHLPSAEARFECQRELEAALTQIDVRALAAAAAGEPALFDQVKRWKTAQYQHTPVTPEQRARLALQQLPTPALRGGLVGDSLEVTRAKAALVIAPGGGWLAVENVLQKALSPVLGSEMDPATVIKGILKERGVDVDERKRVDAVSHQRSRWL